MNSNRTRRGQDDDRFEDHRAETRAFDRDDDLPEPAGAVMRADDLDGQLGPDEMPDPDEVVMNREAKLHH